MIVGDVLGLEAGGDFSDQHDLEGVLAELVHRGLVSLHGRVQHQNNVELFLGRPVGIWVNDVEEDIEVGGNVLGRDLSEVLPEAFQLEDDVARVFVGDEAFDALPVFPLERLFS